MNAIAPVFCRDDMSAASPIKNADQIRLAVMIMILNRLAMVLSDPDLYESDGDEVKQVLFRRQPVVNAAHALSTLSRQDSEGVEIQPFSGELGLSWTSGRAKRVTAMFGPEPDAYSVYYERMVGGRVVEHHLEPHLEPDDHSYLRQRLAWLHT